MLTFTRLEGPHGIPVFYQKLPGEVKSTAIALTVFTGAADDTSVGLPGIYHWFEHVPFRGTKKFPNGYLSTKGPITRVGGKVGAWTNPFCTNYWSTLPTRHLEKGVDIVTDLVAQPLLTDESIIAEREIINQEIRDRNANANGRMQYTTPSILWRDHPLGVHVLGSIESLGSMTPDLLHEARRKGYDRSRMAFFISTNLPYHNVGDLINDRFALLPSNGLSERRMGGSFGPLPWQQGERTEFETEFSASIVKVLFRFPSVRTKTDLVKQSILTKLFSHGGPGSPLIRAVREKNQLCYGAQVEVFNCQDGGCWGFNVNTSLKNVGAVERALPTMLQDQQLRSGEWFETIKEAAVGNLDMEVIDPDKLVESAVRSTMIMGEPLNEEEMVTLLCSVPHEQVLEWIDRIDFEKARTVVALGKG